MAATEEPIEPEMLSGHVVIAGFGLPGRAVAERLQAAGATYCVIELNPGTVVRLAHVGTPVIPGDVSDECVLRQAGVDRARLFAITVPNDPAMLEAVRLAKQMNPALRIIARCRYTSTAIEAHRRGADEVVIEEQVVAKEFGRLSMPPPAAG